MDDTLTITETPAGGYTVSPDFSFDQPRYAPLHEALVELNLPTSAQAMMNRYVEWQRFKPGFPYGMEFCEGVTVSVPGVLSTTGTGHGVDIPEAIAWAFVRQIRADNREAAFLTAGYEAIANMPR